MFGLFGPRPPINTWDKAWVEWRLRWLADRFGIDRLRNAPVVLPTEEFFPAALCRDPAGVRECLDRICGHLGVNPATLTVEVRPDDDMPGAAGPYEARDRSRILVAEPHLNSPPELLAALAHEAAHELLLKGGHLTGDSSDHELVADLVLVFFGIGILPANGRSSAGPSGGWHYWSGAEPKYLSSITLGYALAVFAFVRGDERPPWAVHLGPDAAVTLKAGLAYLRKSGDTLFHPDAAGSVRRPPSVSDAIDRLGHASPTQRLGALWDVGEYKLPAAELVEPVEARLRDRDTDVRCAAAHTLGLFGAAATRSVPRLVQAAGHGQTNVRATALRALGVMGADPAEVVPVLAAALGDESSTVGTSAAAAITRMGPAAVGAEPQLLTAIAAWALTDYPRLGQLVAALRAVSPDPRGRLKEHFMGTDGEVRRLVLGVLRDQGG